jgi:peptidoglycan LD-endopeptidase LytH
LGLRPASNLFTGDLVPRFDLRRSTRTLVIVVATALAIAPAAHAQPDEEAAEQAAREIAAAQDRANQAAGAYLLAQSELEVLADAAARLEDEQAALQAEVDALRGQVEQAAVARFTSAGGSGIPLLTGYRDPSEQLQVEALTDVALEHSADSFDEFESAQSALEDKGNEVADARDRLADQQEQYEQLREAAEREVVLLQETEKKRLADEQVRIALERQRREEQRRLAEEQRIAEEQRLAEQQRQADEQRRQADLQALTAAPSSPSSNNGNSSQLPAAPAPQGADNQAPSDNGSGGGGGGGMVCPVQGASAYADTWGAPRSGGRSHEGVDMLGPTGTPLVAVASGSVQFKQNSLGGNAVWLTGDNGYKYYYAHLSSFEGSSRGVSQGEVIGYIGDTGNARGTPHLHFEVHPGGGAAVNPTPYVRNAGC